MLTLTPMNRDSIDAFMRLYHELCPTVNDEVPLATFARRLGWTIARTEAIALWLDERRLIASDRGLGTDITMIEGL